MSTTGRENLSNRAGTGVEVENRLTGKGALRNIRAASILPFLCTGRVLTQDIISRYRIELLCSQRIGLEEGEGRDIELQS